jgi:hypothetical protein
MQQEKVNKKAERAVVTQQASPATLDELAKLSSLELEALYRQGGVPASLKALDGDLQGRMLAVRGAGHGLLFRALASLAQSASFPWAGKSFAAKSATEGTGINRIQLTGLGRQRLFAFRTRIDPSVIDGAPCVLIDYDDSDNPALIRAIRDEVREVSPGLYLGPACFKRKDSTPVVLWFALDTRGGRARASA